MESDYVQYGCGLSCPDGWLNFDASPRLWIEQLPVIRQLLRASEKALFPENVRFGDIVRGLPVADGSVKGVYCSHVLEHIDRTSVVFALKNTYNMLRPGGVFRLVVPDLAWRAEEFLKAHSLGDEQAADRFLRKCYLGQTKPSKGLANLARHAFGNAAHRWMYDDAALSGLLAAVGFVEIRRCHFGDADEPAFAKVEDQGRFEDHGHHELALEARRPL